MKITKTQLKQLIKEEVAKTLDEIGGPMTPDMARDDNLLAFEKPNVTNLRVNPYGSAEGGKGYEFIMNVAGVGMISGQLNAQSLERLQKSKGGYQSNIMGTPVSDE
jgi:hypothetical protein